MGQHMDQVSRIAVVATCILLAGVTVLLGGGLALLDHLAQRAGLIEGDLLDLIGSTSSRTLGDRNAGTFCGRRATAAASATARDDSTSTIGPTIGSDRNVWRT